MLDDENNNEISNKYFYIFLIGAIAVMLLVFVALGYSVMTEHEQFVEELDGMNCSKLLTEIKDEHSQHKGYGYIDTWIEKECWKY